jgi:hypothetical protein
VCPRLGGRCHLEGCRLPGTHACVLLPCSEGRGAGTHAGGDGGNLAVLFVVLGLVATADWLIFSELRWVHTVTVAVAGWAAGFSVAFVL